ncbi:putative inorganic phosphate cotransporter [Copidosoma floridanum]|uniref:putative inorganic phosphate cotransporter n=1 Tax=Copidosoma floridanum TaxID=29053 RepID=UPI0006C95457|nr:putative inorganic phosphate cotransporter [Copidosoma floridanum]
MIKNNSNVQTKQPEEKFGTRHFQVLLISLCLMTAGAISLSISLAIIPMTDHTSIDFMYFDWTTSETSLVLSSYIWGYALFQVPNSYLASRWSAQKLMTLSLFISSAVNMFLPVITYAGGWIALCIGRITIGSCQSSFSSCSIVLLSKWAPTTERSRMSAFVMSGNVLGAIVAMSLSGLIAASKLGWPGIFYIFGGSGLILSIICHCHVWDCPTLHKTICPMEKEFIVKNLQQVENHCEIDKTINPPWKKILTSIPVWTLIVAECGSNWGRWTFNTEMPKYMKNILHFNIAENGLISTLPYSTFWILSFAFSWASDYAMRKNISISRIRRTCNTVGMWGPALALVALCLIGTSSKIWPVVLLILAIGLKAGTSSGYVVNSLDLTPNFAGTVYSFTTCLSSFVSMLAPIVCGLIVTDETDVRQWHTVFYVTSAVYFTTNLFYVFFGRGKTRSWNNPLRKISVSTIYDPNAIKINP